VAKRRNDSRWATLAALILVAGGFDLVTQWLRGELDVTREHLEDFLVAMVTARSA